MQVRIHALWAILLIWAGASHASAQSRSTSDLVAPDSAALLAGGGPSFGWLHVVNAPLTLEEAMTIMPVQHGGYANAVKSTVISVEFDYGVVNRPGVDFAIIDGQYDVGNYRLTTDYDGFTTQVIVNMATGSSIGTETYFYEVTGSTTSADVVSLEVDLASFAIPPGAVVHELRFETLDNQCDPIGLARVHDGFWLGVTQLDAGLKGGVQTCGGTPGGAVGVAYSLTGPGPSSLSVGACGSLSVELSLPITTLVTGTNDPNGEFVFSSSIPASAAGTAIWLQALDLASCTLSPGVATFIN